MLQAIELHRRRVLQQFDRRNRDGNMEDKHEVRERERERERECRATVQLWLQSTEAIRAIE
jgi:hypothetical protein